MLFRLSTLGARVVELPIETVYRDEKSNLSELRCLATFPLLHLRNFAKRIFYNYFLRNFSIASLISFWASCCSHSAASTGC